MGPISTGTGEENTVFMYCGALHCKEKDNQSRSNEDGTASLAGGPHMVWTAAWQSLAWLLLPALVSSSAEPGLCLPLWAPWDFDSHRVLPGQLCWSPG